MSQTNTHRRVWRGGFTAVEMLIVVTIIGIMVASVMPRISRIVAESRIRSLQHEVAADVERAFALVQRQHKPVTVTYSTTTNVITITDRASGTVLFTDYIGRFDTMSTTDVTFSPSGGITIYPMGIATAALTITITNGNFTRTITASRAGQVTKS